MCLDTHMKLALYKYVIIIIIITKQLLYNSVKHREHVWIFSRWFHDCFKIKLHKLRDSHDKVYRWYQTCFIFFLKNVYVLEQYIAIWFEIFSEQDALFTLECIESV